jgi:sugar lactone lactonase YvrE
MIKLFFVLSAFFFSSLNFAQQVSLEKIWQTDTILKTPESVLFDAKQKQLFVANINGNAFAKDGNGFISLLNLDGTIKELEFVKGLDAPKGMAYQKGKLYVSDIDKLITINVATKKIEATLTIAGALFLNDVSIAPNGTIYVSDSRGKKVYSVVNNTASVFIDSIQSPNGVLFAKNNLYVLSAGRLMQFNNTATDSTVLASGMEASTDGVELFGKGYLVSCWIGTAYFIDASGNKTKLLDTQANKVNTTDIGINTKEKIVYIPNFNANTVTAYKIVEKP